MMAVDADGPPLAICLQAASEPRAPTPLPKHKELITAPLRAPSKENVFYKYVSAMTLAHADHAN